MTDFLAFFVPWEFSWLVQIAVWSVLLLYFNGLRKSTPDERPGYAPIIAFVVGVAGMYLVTQTRFDYWSQYMFFVHRGQHLVLHHLAPFLIALSMPAAVLARGLPRAVRAWFARRRLLRAAWVGVYRTLQHPAIACVLFVGLIAFWLTPEIHFDAMLNVTLYWVMNWSMALDGLLFWWLMFEHGGGPLYDPARSRRAFAGPPPRFDSLIWAHQTTLDEAEPEPPAKTPSRPRRVAQRPPGITPRLGYGTRVLLLFAVMVPQIVIGASITFADANWFEVYAVCGRAWPLDPMTDQHIGGLITWVPAAMMSVIGALVILRFWIYDDAARHAVHNQEVTR